MLSVRVCICCGLQELKYRDFDSLNGLEKMSYVLGSELWEDYFSSGGHSIL